MPELLSGTLRQNLDPFEQHDDVTLNKRPPHDYRRGIDLSVGQRQISRLRGRSL
ncbi:hypothetical protein CPB84DRAFT_1795930, partial [Gymnopilus junonius]